MAEGTEDLLLDTAAALVPGIPAGASKLARAAKAASKASKCKAAKKAKRVAKCEAEAIHAAYHSLSCKSCGKRNKKTKCNRQRSGTSCADIALNIACWTAVSAGRKAYLDKKCDYYLADSIREGAKKKEQSHKKEYAKSALNLLTCSEIYATNC